LKGQEQRLSELTDRCAVLLTYQCSQKRAPAKTQEAETPSGKLVVLREEATMIPYQDHRQSADACVPRHRCHNITRIAHNRCSSRHTVQAAGRPWASLRMAHSTRSGQRGQTVPMSKGVAESSDSEARLVVITGGQYGTCTHRIQIMEPVTWIEPILRSLHETSLPGPQWEPPPSPLQQWLRALHRYCLIADRFSATSLGDSCAESRR
jgi:hypothetical protein